jgi:hypothetical protein
MTFPTINKLPIVYRQNWKQFQHKYPSLLSRVREMLPPEQRSAGDNNSHNNGDKTMAKGAPSGAAFPHLSPAQKVIAEWCHCSLQ